MIITVYLGTERLFSMPVRHQRITVGRSKQCDLILPLPEVSRLHAEIVPRGQSLHIEDRSRNGIVFSGHRTTSATIHVGDAIQLAGYGLRFEADYSSLHESDTGSAIAFTASGTHANQFCEMVGDSEPMRHAFEQIRRIAGSSAYTLILGETGTGKELVARALHSLGERRSGPWVPVNCAAISPELVESELFGHERGAFTGAAGRRIGAIEAAHEGTLFLDEIGEMPLALQPKLLRVLDTRQFCRVGGGSPLTIDARIIAATNRDLATDVGSGRFRHDLFQRLCVIPIALPPLRDRGDDALLLAEHFLSGTASRGSHLTPEATDLLLSYDWPGNVRELRNVVARLLSEKINGPVDVGQLRAAISAGRAAYLSDPKQAYGDVEKHTFRDPGEVGLRGNARILSRGPSQKDPDSLRDVERVAILRAIEDCGGNKRAAARRLGISPTTLYKKVNRMRRLASEQ